MSKALKMADARKIRLQEFRRTLHRIWHTKEITGAERLIAWTSYFTRIFSIPFWLLIPFEVESEDANTERHPRIEAYLTCELLALIAVLLVATKCPVISVAVAIYFLWQIYLALLEIVFVSKLTFMKPEVISVERSLLLFVINAAEIVVAFAIFYRTALCYSPGAAVVNSLLVFGTVGHPLNGNPSLVAQDWGGVVVSAQLVCDFLFIAIFLSAFLGGLRPGGRKDVHR